MTSIELTREQVRHLQRRLTFAATPGFEAMLAGRDAEAALELIWAASAAAPEPPTPAFVSEPWVNTALAYRALGADDRAGARTDQVAVHRRLVEELRQAWLLEMVREPALRENLVLFWHSLLGSSSAVVEIPQALHARQQTLRRTCMTSVPEVLEALVTDPAMLIQIGMDGHGPDRVSDRPAKLILDHWTVGPGAYGDADVGELSRALTGWTLGGAAATTEPFDPLATALARRTGLVPQFDPARFEAGPKTILGSTQEFDARTAVRFLALHPATARRVGNRLLRHLGVDDETGALQTRLESVYLATGGSVEALLRETVMAAEFWSEATRWSLIKSPVHLAVGACRALELADPPAQTLSRWLTACGQPLFDTPNNGEGGWAGQEAWLATTDRLAMRYRLPALLAGASLELGLAGATSGESHARSPLPATTPAALADRLDPAPGLSLGALARERDPWAAADFVMASPQYQLA